MTRFSLHDEIANVYLPFRLLDAKPRRFPPQPQRPSPPRRTRALLLKTASVAVAVIAVIALSGV